MARLPQVPFALNAANTVVVISIAFFLLVPFLHSSGLSELIDSILGRVVLIGLVLYGITLGPLPGVFSFLAVAAMFTERNRYRILITQKSIISRGSVPTLGVVDMPHSMPAPTQNQLPDQPWLKYDHTGSFMEGDGWQGPVGESEDDKQVLESQLYPNDRQDRFYVNTGLAPSDPRA